MSKVVRALGNVGERILIGIARIAVVFGVVMTIVAGFCAAFWSFIDYPFVSIPILVAICAYSLGGLGE